MQSRQSVCKFVNGLFDMKMDQELEKVKDLEVVLQDLANCKVQVEAMDSAYKQALLDKDHHEKTIDGLSMLLKTSEFEKDIYINECKQTKIHASRFKSNIQKLADELRPAFL
ncbi:hypothetical protein L2E82_25615 [Cichorium intybus]|uniref:Uncharacterized protein n=1 Tax=Cichorium intybus TaxID=13427 RepID=A0ACB9E3R6_CICIN|nr:hypothetical protein L2E82_25615 [Cichorium intybus]